MEKSSGIKKNSNNKPMNTTKSNNKKIEQASNKTKKKVSSEIPKSTTKLSNPQQPNTTTITNQKVTDGKNNMEEEDVVALVQKLRKEMKESRLKEAKELEKKKEESRKKDESSFKILVNKPKRDQIDTSSMPVAEYTTTKLQDKKFANLLQNKVNTEDDISKVVEWGIKHDVRYNLENILLPDMDSTPEEIEEKKKKKAELKKAYEDYVNSVPEEEEEKRGKEDISFKQFVNSITEEEEEDVERPKKQLPKNIEIVESDKLSSKPHKKTDLQKLSQRLSTVNKKPSSYEELAHKETMDSSKEKPEVDQNESSPTFSTTILNLTDEQYSNAMSNPVEFNKQWELKGYSPVIQNNHGRKILILYPIGTNTKKVVEKVKNATNKDQTKPLIVAGSKGRIPLRDLLVDESTKDEVDLESSNFDERDLEKKLIDAKNYFLEYGYDISDLNTILKDDEIIKKKKEKTQPKKIEKTTAYDKLQDELENEENETPISNLLDEYLGDDDPNQIFQSLEEKNLLLSEYETKSEYAMFSEDIHPYLKKSTKENEDKLRKEIANMSIGSISLPPELVEGVSEIVSEYPKNLIQRTAQILSAAFRLRTNGLDKNPKVFSRSDEEKKLNKDESPEDELFREQLEVLKHLRSYKETSKKKKRPIDIEKMKKDSEEEFNRTYNPQIIYKELESAAYIAHRLPAIYGTSYRVFSEAVMRMPDFEPKTMLDFGTGPGTTIWAAHEAFGGSVKEVMAVEPSTAMMDVASRLFEYMNNKPHITWRRFLNEHSSKQYDLVVASFVMNELSNSQERERIVKALWKLTSGVLIIIEPGTPVGFDFIREARSTVLTQKYININDKPTILAPCPHDSVCPMAGTPKWCHFAQRVEREEFQKLTKQAKKQYENENYSFIAFKRHGLDGFKYGEQVEKEEEEEMRKKQIREQLPDSVVEKEIALRKELRGYAREFSLQSFRWPRITDTPLKRGGHVITSMCLPEGTLSKVIISKADGKQGYKYLRKTLKGDLYPYPLNPKNLKASAEMEKYFKDLE
ncbi:predicted protein [Naegleria gruberi]|uniref:Predicted protein n=1 Tax=Naegleria gruberi TaxID=5762 RepID=D2UYG2_NAEGR|nr:uncharacterized protein NAEGRDRAFT_56521 [Naegleria gruberi]EFC50787.1 predicted protein [Naegleria gruberi]|eukprot:XP_002683531.1 predicted protein [Naegleria gruberi strain NEG-M]